MLFPVQDKLTILTMPIAHTTPLAISCGHQFSKCSQELFTVLFTFLTYLFLDTYYQSYQTCTILAYYFFVCTQQNFITLTILNATLRVFIYRVALRCEFFLTIFQKWDLPQSGRNLHNWKKNENNANSTSVLTLVFLFYFGTSGSFGLNKLYGKNGYFWRC